MKIKLSTNRETHLCLDICEWQLNRQWARDTDLRRIDSFSVSSLPFRIWIVTRANTSSQMIQVDVRKWINLKKTTTTTGARLQCTSSVYFMVLLNSSQTGGEKKTEREGKKCLTKNCCYFRHLFDSAHSSMRYMHNSKTIFLTLLLSSAAHRH